MTHLHVEFKVSEAGPHIRGWINSVYKGAEPYFTRPDVTSIGETLKVYHWKQFDARRREFERTYGNRLADLLQKCGNSVGEVYASTESAERAELTAQSILEPGLRRLLPTMYYDVELFFARRALSSVEFKANEFDIADPNDIPEMAAWNKQTIGSKVTQISNTTRKRIGQIIRKALREGASITTIVDKLVSNFAFDRVRAYRIARTEIVSSSNAATHFSVGHHVPTGKMTKDWLATGDKRTRPTHVTAGASQRSVKFDKPFKVGGGEMMFPGDGSLGAPAKEIVQCRCTALYSVPRPPGF